MMVSESDQSSVEKRRQEKRREDRIREEMKRDAKTSTCSLVIQWRDNWTR